MMNHTKIVTVLAALGFGLGFAGCSNSPVVLTPGHPAGPNAKYIQIERLSRPAIKEVFEPFQHHQISNAAEPYNDPTIKADIATTEDAIRYGGTPASGPDYGAALQGILYPDEYAVNLNGGNPTTKTQGEYFLSNEVTGSFGGRAPNDDVINLELGILFGNTIPALGLAPDDGKENTCLSSQNIAGPYVYGGQNPKKTATGSFPYFPTPS
ncbi:MAG: DUF4331 family protein [Candidatus Eremiobacteraeota bacterium]|nr:DUF4331 family protein [Candidatus Eremiobacteraeota bacterium]MBC5803708.1 DUF4331 family protein [Candidatus Eremiobacteraeota bacterium]MBC5823069.1 DUF4331 family protein [Candidatus Eremiobacteraeota bacterium]